MAIFLVSFFTDTHYSFLQKINSQLQITLS